ncbi:MAG: efflux RND transporter periplasmic adaptor subunit [Gemmatimonadaceae bacterium]|jgi:cobalt-zinc-cadmium efflux system membrane fusion protein|nr:efflux RND transporter periplasmic adaptor subunit [Gemmatimonadaceae bacterium]
MSSPRRPPLLARLARTALTLAVVACSGGTPDDTGAADAAPVVTDSTVRFARSSPSLRELTVDTVQLRRERVVATLPAQLVFDEEHTTRVQSPVAGRITRLVVAPGDRVAQGAELAHIASADAAAATSDVEKADAVRVQAQAALARAQDLYANRVIALKDLEQARADAAQAQAEWQRARARTAQLGTGRSVGQDYVLRAPVGGEVVERTVQPGSEVRPDNGVTLFTISALDTLWLSATAYQRDLSVAHVGDRLVFVTEAFPGRRFEAVVRYVGSELDPATRTVQLRATLPNPGGELKPQMFGEARLVVEDTAGALMVPSGALVTTGAGPVLYVELAPGQFVRRLVDVESDDGTQAIVRRGVKAGERIVTRGALFLAAEQAKGR